MLNKSNRTRLIVLIGIFSFVALSFLSSCGMFRDSGEKTSSPSTTRSLVSIVITPANPSIALGITQQFTATGTFSDGSTQDMTSSVTWSSSAMTVATISNIAGSNGLAAPVSAGSTTITASSGSISGSTTVNVVTLALIAVVSPNPGIALGTTEQFTATGVFSDNSKRDITSYVTWSSSAPSVATISNTAGSNGLVTPVAAGSTTIIATFGSISGSTNLTVTAAALVSIAVTSTSPSIAPGTAEQFTAIGTFTDNSTQDLTGSVTWSSLATSVATISNAAGSKGMVASVAAGNTIITATSGNVSGSAKLTVTSATLVSIAVTPLTPSVVHGATQQFTAKGTFSDNTTQDITATVTWSSSNASVATISNTAGSNGNATSISAGSTTISATSGSISGSTTLTVT